MVICDVCGEEITDASKAMVSWKFRRPWRLGAIEDLRFCHKGQCDDRTRECWMQLDAFFLYLLNNTGLTEKKLKEARGRAHWLAAAGL